MQKRAICGGLACQASSLPVFPLDNAHLNPHIHFHILEHRYGKATGVIGV